MLETISMLTAASEYVLRGWSVIPVRSHDKRPLVEWKEYQTRLPTSEELRKWFGDGTANIGIVTGALSGIIAIDVDGDAGLTSMNTLNPFLPETRTHKTPRGYHMIYKYTPELHTGAAFAPGLDVRSDGGYIVAPPSEVGGVRYTAINDGDPVVLPLIPEILKAGQRSLNGSGPASNAPKWVAEALTSGSGEGERNQMATRLAGYFRSKGMAEDIVLSVLSPFAERCSPPLRLAELLVIVQSVCRYDAKVQELRVTDPPTFTDLGDGYRFTWSDRSLSVTIDKLNQERDGLHCEIVVEAMQPGFAPLLYGPARYNLSSTPAAASLSKYLRGFVEAIDWQGILQPVSKLTVALWRQGEPLQDLSDEVAEEPIVWSALPYVLQGHPNIIFGDGGTGKSTLALVLAMTLCGSTSYLPGIKAGRKYQFLYLDWESDAQEHRRRAKALGFFNVERVSIKYQYCSATLADMVSEIKRLCKEHSIDGVVIDSAAAACGGKPEEAESTLKFFGALRSLHVTSIVVAHNTKDGTQGKPFGSAFWYNYGRNIWEVRKAQEPGEGQLHIGLYHRKINSAGLFKPRGLVLRFGDGEMFFEPEDLRQVADLARGLGKVARIEASLLLQSGRTAKELAAELGEGENTIAALLSDYKGKRFLSDGLRPAHWAVLDAHHQEEG